MSINGIHKTLRIKSVNVVLETLNFNSERYADLMIPLIAYGESMINYEMV